MYKSIVHFARIVNFFRYVLRLDTLKCGCETYGASCGLKDFTLSLQLTPCNLQSENDLRRHLRRHQLLFPVRQLSRGGLHKGNQPRVPVKGEVVICPVCQGVEAVLVTG